MHNGNEPVLVLTSPPMMKRLLVTSKGQELHQAILSPMMKNTTTGEDTRARLVKAWEITL